MKNIFLLLFLLGAGLNAEVKPSFAADKKTPKTTLKVEYDRFKETTSLTTPTSNSYGMTNICLAVLSSARQKPESVSIYFAQSHNRIRWSEPKVTFLFGGTRWQSTPRSRVSVIGGQFYESVWVDVPVGVFVAMSRSDIVDVQVGYDETRIQKKNIASWEELAEYLDVLPEAKISKVEPVKPSLSIRYDRFQNSTSVSTTSNYNGKLGFSPLFTFEGENPVAPEEVSITFVHVVRNFEWTMSAPKITLLYGDEKFAAVSVSDNKPLLSDGLWVEATSIRVPTETFLKMLKSDSIEVQVGQEECKIEKANLGSWREMGSYIAAITNSQKPEKEPIITNNPAT